MGKDELDLHIGDINYARAEYEKHRANYAELLPILKAALHIKFGGVKKLKEYLETKESANLIEKMIGFFEKGIIFYFARLAGKGVVGNNKSFLFSDLRDFVVEMEKQKITVQKCGLPIVARVINQKISSSKIIYYHNDPDDSENCTIVGYYGTEREITGNIYVGRGYVSRNKLVKHDSSGIFYHRKCSEKHTFVMCRWENNVKIKEEMYSFCVDGYYLGDLKKLFKDGKGVFCWFNGDKYEGEWKGDLENGLGKYCYSNGDKYEGEFKNGLRGGKGTYIRADGSRYDGEWKNNVLMCIYANGKTYKGFKDGRIAGKGMCIYTNGDKYEGEFKNGLMKGWGTYFCGNEKRYEGEWENDVKYGKGTYYLNGGTYEGEFKNDSKNGKGTFFYGNEESYDGDWKDDVKNGKGMYFYINGDKYVGEWKNNKKEGKGVYIYANGNKYEGWWKNDVKESIGTYIFFKTNEQYYVSFQKGSLNGMYEYIDEKGVSHSNQDTVHITEDMKELKIGFKNIEDKNKYLLNVEKLKQEVEERMNLAEKLKQKVKERRNVVEELKQKAQQGKKEVMELVTVYMGNKKKIAKEYREATIIKSLNMLIAMYADLRATVEIIFNIIQNNGDINPLINQRAMVYKMAVWHLKQGFIFHFEPVNKYFTLQDLQKIMESRKHSEITKLFDETPLDEKLLELQNKYINYEEAKMISFCNLRQIIEPYNNTVHLYFGGCSQSPGRRGLFKNGSSVCFECDKDGSEHPINIFRVKWGNNLPGKRYECWFGEGAYFLGKMENNKFHGDEKYYDKNGSFYAGNWENGLKHGKGYYCIPNEYLYEGNWRSDLMNGDGNMYYANGDIYAGHWKNSKKDGKGTYYYSDGSKYQGEWKCDLKQGAGYMYYPNGEKYIGKWENNKQENKGIFCFSDGGKYVGEFKNNAREGIGEFFFPNGDEYIGEWKGSEEEGIEKYYKIGVGLYAGMWKNGKKHGPGILCYENGSKYEGFWENNGKGGVGVFVDSKGEIYPGEWQEEINNKHVFYCWKNNELVEFSENLQCLEKTNYHQKNTMNEENEKENKSEEEMQQEPPNGFPTWGLLINYYEYVKYIYQKLINNLVDTQQRKDIYNLPKP